MPRNKDKRENVDEPHQKYKDGQRRRGFSSDAPAARTRKKYKSASDRHKDKAEHPPEQLSKRARRRLAKQQAQDS